MSEREQKVVITVREREGVALTADVHRMVRGLVSYADAYGVRVSIDRPEASDQGR